MTTCCLVCVFDLIMKRFNIYHGGVANTINGFTFCHTKTKHTNTQYKLKWPELMA